LPLIALHCARGLHHGFNATVKNVCIGDDDCSQKATKTAFCDFLSGMYSNVSCMSVNSAQVIKGELSVRVNNSGSQCRRNRDALLFCVFNESKTPHRPRRSLRQRHTFAGDSLLAHQNLSRLTRHSSKRHGSIKTANLTHSLASEIVESQLNRKPAPSVNETVLFFNMKRSQKC
jgi:hypothetical protein